MVINYQYWNIKFVPAISHVSVDDAIIMDDSDISRCFDTMVKQQRNVIVHCREGYMRRLVTYMMSNYIFVKAAGGIVENRAGEKLLMIRNDRADLPKGKVELGETLREAALRETAEETGLTNIELQSLVTKTYHIYDLYGGWHFKQTTWFGMLFAGNQNFVPQTEEGITEGLWLPMEDWAKRLSDSYSTMQVIVSKVVGNPIINSNS